MITTLFPFLAAVAAETSLISVLIWLLVFALIVYLVFFILSKVPIPQPWGTVITCIVGLILLLVLLRQFAFI